MHSALQVGSGPIPMLDRWLFLRALGTLNKSNFQISFHIENNGELKCNKFPSGGVPLDPHQNKIPCL